MAVERGQAIAARRGIEVRWVVEDVLTVELDEGSFDLVLLSYLQLPWDQMQQVIERAMRALAPGGTFLLIGHDRNNLERGYGGPSSAAVLYSPEQVAGVLTDLVVDRMSTVERVVDTEAGPRVALDCLVRARKPGR